MDHSGTSFISHADAEKMYGAERGEYETMEECLLRVLNDRYMSITGGNVGVSEVKAASDGWDICWVG